MKIGYVRVSKQEQGEELQIDALKEAGCNKWFLDKMTGSKAERKGLDSIDICTAKRDLRCMKVGSSRTLVTP